MIAEGTAQSTLSLTSLLGRLAASAVFVVAILALLNPARDALVILTIDGLVWTARLVGLSATAAPSGVVSFISPGTGSFAYRIVEECTAIAVVGVFCVPVIALPGMSLRQRVVALAAGVSVLLVANWMRLLTLAWLGVHQPAVFELAHVWLWQMCSIALVTGGWLSVLRWGRARNSRAQRTARLLWFAATAVGLGVLMEWSGWADHYSNAVEAPLRLVQAGLNRLPYDVIAVAEGPVREWVVHVRGTSLVLTVSLATTLLGPRFISRLHGAAATTGMVWIAHVLGSLLGRGLRARIETLHAQFVDTIDVPLLVLDHSWAVLVPLILWYRIRGSIPSDVHRAYTTELGSVLDVPEDQPVEFE